MKSTNHCHRDTNIESSAATPQQLAASPITPFGSGTGPPRPAATPIQATSPADAGGGAGARSPEIQGALSGQHDFSWFTDNFHLAKANNVIAADNAERRERQRSASLVASPEPAKDETKVKMGIPVLNLENKKLVSPGKGEKADDSKELDGGRSVFAFGSRLLSSLLFEVYYNIIIQLLICDRSTLDNA